MSTNPSRLKPICSCSSYAFPHRAGGGRCECEAVWRRHYYHLTPGDRGPDRYELTEVCAGCGQPAETKAMDFGIGSYEYWGCPGVDVDIQQVTECCETGTVPNTWSQHVKHNWEVLT